MNKRSLLLILMVMICLLTGGVLIFSENKKRLQESQVYQIKGDVIIEPNQKITEDMVEKVSQRVFYLPKDTILDNSMVGKYAKTTLYGGRPIVRREIDASPIVDNKLGYNLKPGERVVSITIDISESVGGLVTKGQYVDLQWVYSVDQQTKINQPLFNHLEVLDVHSKYGATIGGSSQKSESSKINLVGDTGSTGLKDMFPLEAIIRVTDVQLQAINLAEESGKVKLGINPAKEDTSLPLPPISTEELLNRGVLGR
jgi:Flp pilus assembly protein CpaB